jgi:presenilin-like A22 family membrane protease
MLKVRSYGFAIVASAVAMVAGPAALVGLPFGIWALVLLTRREVQGAFDGR